MFLLCLWLWIVAAGGIDRSPRNAFIMYLFVGLVICHIYKVNASLGLTLISAGELPLDWRRANISPIFKKGATTDPANYRPVSLTCTCCKLLEHIIDSQLMRHLSKFNIIADNQHAFRKKRSCETQLILTTHDLLQNLDKKIPTDVGVLDFSKAFDVIPHKRLLLKLDHYGIRNKTRDWIKSFLTNRSQRVMINGTASDWKPVLSGTPQGTVLGPHLFLIFINDIHKNITSTVRLFADDCLVYRTITSAEDQHQLQEDLDKLVDWAQTWGMRFNPSKCKSVTITRRRQGEPTNYTLMGVDLEEKKDIQYLGVHIQHDLRWNKQTAHATSKATRVLNFIRRNFHHCTPHVKEKLYMTLVRPHLEYASASWDPYTKKNIHAIERVQNRAARFVSNTYGENTSITAILKELKWTALEDRRKCHRLTCFLKMLNGNLDIKHEDFIQPKIDRNRRGHSIQYQQLHTNSEAFANSFFVRTTTEWNKLLQSTVDQPSLHTFQNALAKDPSVLRG